MAATATEEDALLSVFLSNKRAEVFHSVEHRHQIWRENPFDVELVHREARLAFQRMLAQATTPPGLDSGRILLLRGDAGSGKTHLVRAFRNHVHVNGLGFVGYMQMTTSASSFERYLVSNLIDSLDQPYYESLGTTTGLLRLSNAVAARCGDAAAIQTLVDTAELDPEMIVELVERAADRLIAQPRYADLDLDLVRALLYLQRQDAALKKRVLKYLRCEELSARDLRRLGDLSPKHGEADAQKLVEHLGRLMWAFDTRSLVLCVDQFEDLHQLDDADTRFRRVVASLCAVADQVPSSVVVIACLDDHYSVLRQRLTLSMLDRLEYDPAPVRLVSKRNAEEVKMIVRQRLDYLYETASVKPPEGAVDDLYPFPPAFIQSLAGTRLRDVLDQCRMFREACAVAGRIDALPAAATPRAADPSADERLIKTAKEKLEQQWNDYLAQSQEEPPESDEELAEILGWAIRTCADELESCHRFEVAVKDDLIEVRVLVPLPGGAYRAGEELLLKLCNKAPQGGGLRAQLEETVRLAQHRIPVFVRCLEFPSNPKAAVTQVLADIIKNKRGRKVVVEDSDWRKIIAFRRFRAANDQRDHFKQWLMEENHLSRLMPLIQALELDHLDRFESKPAPRRSAPTPVTPPQRSQLDGSPASASPPEVGAAQSSEPPLGSPPQAEAREGSAGVAPIIVGTTGELISQELVLSREDLTAHSAFLGGTGSGKTTLALNIVEQLLRFGVPAILVDRKGDLASYAREGLWRERHPDAVLDERRRALCDRLDIALFTPGHKGGRPLAISLMPRGLGGLPELDREQAAGYAADALSDMLGYKRTRKDKSLRVILAQAFRLFAVHGDADKFTLESLIAFIDNEDPALVSALGRLDSRLFKELVQDLETLKLGASDLLAPSAEQVDAELLLGVGCHARPGKTRLSIISTKFLHDTSRILFWVSQLLLSLTRWVARAPSPKLQAVILFDEADVYLPAQSQPATKAPMENLLRRARSGGLGILLATQSPGDFDYKCRDNVRSWFAGRVTQTVALDKMKPLFAEARGNVGARIPGQQTGEFHLLQHGGVTPFRAHRSLLHAEQVPDDEILKLAAQRRGSMVR